MQFFNPFRIPLGVLYLSVFILVYYFQGFFCLFCTRRHSRFQCLEIVIFKLIVLYCISIFIYNYCGSNAINLRQYSPDKNKTNQK